MDKDISRIRFVFANYKQTNKWLAKQLGKDSTTVAKWCTINCQTTLGPLMKRLTTIRFQRLPTLGVYD